ncbi:hypothetical protein LY76DRAFT_303852 [Colletotrichum caudatum]|nr:hypothetical protein LY76DRAFT_303852 [Colletotrichum caudatum]
MRSHSLIETVPHKSPASSSGSGTSWNVGLVEPYNDNNSYNRRPGVHHEHRPLGLASFPRGHIHRKKIHIDERPLQSHVRLGGRAQSCRRLLEKRRTRHHRRHHLYGSNSRIIMYSRVHALSRASARLSKNIQSYPMLMNVQNPTRISSSSSPNTVHSSRNPMPIPRI